MSCIVLMVVLEVVETLLWKEFQRGNGANFMLVDLILDQDMGDIIFETLYCSHTPLLE